jgi:hypothetical protein
VIVAEVLPRHVPMEILGLDVQGEGIRQQHPECRRDVPCRVRPELRWGPQAPALSFRNIFTVSLLLTCDRTESGYGAFMSAMVFCECMPLSSWHVFSSYEGPFPLGKAGTFGAQTTESSCFYVLGVPNPCLALQPQLASCKQGQLRFATSRESMLDGSFGFG